MAHRSDPIDDGLGFDGGGDGALLSSGAAPMLDRRSPIKVHPKKPPKELTAPPHLSGPWSRSLGLGFGTKNNNL